MRDPEWQSSLDLLLITSVISTSTSHISFNKQKVECYNVYNKLPCVSTCTEMKCVLMGLWLWVKKLPVAIPSDTPEFIQSTFLLLNIKTSLFTA